MTMTKRVIFALISVAAVTFPILFLTKTLEKEVAFPLMFTMLGIQQLYSALFINKFDESNKKVKKISIIFAIGFIIFGLGVVLPYYLLTN